MKKFFLMIVFASLVLIPLLDSAFATTFDINMPTGSASPDAPYFWQNEKTGEATGDIEVVVGDTVVWKNGDQAKHTITSGTLEDGPDGIFGGTDFLAPGQFYSFTFKEKGSYPYFCLIHPWMTGVVTVTDAGFKILSGVGKDVGDGKTTFNVDYQYSGVISAATINEEKKSITFDITSDPKSLDQNLTLLLPSDLIEGPYAIFVDGKKDLTFDYIPGEINTVEIELSEKSYQVTVVGTKIVPEFGTLYLIVLGFAIASIVIFQKSKIVPRI